MALSAIWQVRDMTEYDWVKSVFGDFISQEIFDGRHEVVLDNCFVIDTYLHTRPAAYFSSFQGKNAFLIHLSDETYEGGYEIYPYFRGVFRNYWSFVFNPGRVMTFPLGTGPLPLDVHALPESRERRYLWSFMGEANKASRPAMLRALRPIGPQFTYLTDDKTGPRKPLSRAEYQNVLLQSVFVPSPMGNVNLESWRIYEALECGAIPIVERRATLDYFRGLLGPNPLPAFSKWTDARDFIARMAADPDEMEDFRRQCLAWWKRYKAGLKDRIGGFISGAAETPSPPVGSRLYRVPFWGGFELLRHHSMGALQKRISLMARRLVLERKLRVTVGR